MVADGLAIDAADVARKKRLALLLGELDDDEFAILHVHGQSFGTGDYSAWDSINLPNPYIIGFCG